jgi:tetratricopeptide (TPR) repeat protein
VTARDPREAEARSAFEAGVAALTDERYADALRYFQRSYDIRRAASAALNLGVTLRALGRLVEARQRFNEFLELASPAQHERHDREVAQFIADLSRRLGRIRVAVVEPAGARVLIDGRRAQLDERDEVSVDPGEHRVEGVMAGYDTAVQMVTVESGQTADVQLRLRRPVIEQRVIVAPSTSSRTTSVWQSPAFWAVVGVAVTAAVAIPISIAVTSQPEIPRLTGLFCVRTDGALCDVAERR